LRTLTDGLFKEGRLRMIVDKTKPRQLPIDLPRNETAEWWTWSVKLNLLYGMSRLGLIAEVESSSLLQFAFANVHIVHIDYRTESAENCFPDSHLDLRRWLPQILPGLSFPNKLVP
jgi:hypothetical protein